MTQEEETSCILGIIQAFLESGRITQAEADEIDRKISGFILKQEEMPSEFVQAVDEHFEELI